MIIINKILNNAFSSLGTIWGSFYINSNKTTKLKLINNIENKSNSYSSRLYGKLYYFYFSFIKIITSPEKDFFVDFKPTNDVKLRLNIKQKTQRQIFLMRPYEASIRTYFDQNLKKDDIFLDIGANVGYYTLLAASIVGEEGGVVAFEPEEENFNNLTHNIEINNLKNVEAVKKAVGQASVEMNLYLNPLNEGGHSLIKMEEYSDNNKIIKKETYIQNKAGFKEFQTIKTISIDEYLFSYPHLNHISLIKIDVEGYEIEVLKGMKKLLESKRAKKIICEVSQNNSEVFNLFLENSYNIYRFGNHELLDTTNKSIRSAGNYLFVLRQ